MDKCLYLYVGTADTPNDTVEDALYLDIVAGGREIPVENSPSTDGMSGDEFLTQLEKLLNIAKLLGRELNLSIRIDVDELVEVGENECFDERSMRNIQKLLKEVLD